VSQPGKTPRSGRRRRDHGRRRRQCVGTCRPSRAVIQDQRKRSAACCMPPGFATVLAAPRCPASGVLPTSCSGPRKSLSSLTVVTGTVVLSTTPSRRRTAATGRQRSRATGYVIAIQTPALWLLGGWSSVSGSTRIRRRAPTRSPKSSGLAVVGQEQDDPCLSLCLHRPGPRGWSLGPGLAADRTNRSCLVGGGWKDSADAK